MARPRPKPELQSAREKMLLGPALELFLAYRPLVPD